MRARSSCSAAKDVAPTCGQTPHFALNHEKSRIANANHHHPPSSRSGTNLSKSPEWTKPADCGGVSWSARTSIFHPRIWLLSRLAEKIRVARRPTRGPSRRGPRLRRLGFGSPHFLGTFCSLTLLNGSPGCWPRSLRGRRIASSQVAEPGSSCRKFDGKNRRNYDGPMVT